MKKTLWIALWMAGMIGVGVGQQSKNVYIPGDAYTAYNIPEGGSSLQLNINRANTDIFIDNSQILMEDTSDAVDWWYDSGASSAAKHVYQIGTVLSSREYLRVFGLYHGKGGGGGGGGTPPSFNVWVAAPDVDFAVSLSEEQEEVVGIWMPKGGTARKEVFVRPVACRGSESQQTLTWNSLKISLWTDPWGGSILSGSSKTLSADQYYTYYAQGDNASGSIRDSEIEVSYTVSGNTTHDRIKLTVVGAAISPFSTIMVNATNDVSVTLTPNPPGITNTLQIVCLNGSGSAVFSPSGGTILNIAQSGTVKIKGVTASSVSNNMMLKAMMDGTILASNVFTVIAPEVNLSANDLYGAVADAIEATIGAYVHWNLDNDDSSDNTVGAPKHSGGDYLQTGVAQVTGENDPKSLSMSLQPDLSQGTVVLSIDNAKGKVWKAQTKGSTNLVLAGSGDKTWDLANSSQKADFQSLCSSLWVEGVDAGTCNVKLVYKDTSGAEICSDIVKYTFIAADCGNQPTTTDTPSQRGRFEGAFPNLIHCEWSITDGTFPNYTYNCIAWSVGESGFWYNPDFIDQNFGDNDGVFENSDMDEFYLAKKGWQPTASGAADAEAMYYPYPADWDYVNDPPPAIGYHGAKKKGCECGVGKWIMFESKCGPWEKIEHVWNQLNGSSYGSPGRFYK